MWLNYRSVVIPITEGLCVCCDTNHQQPMSAVIHIPTFHHRQQI